MTTHHVRGGSNSLRVDPTNVPYIRPADYDRHYRLISKKCRMLPMIGQLRNLVTYNFEIIDVFIFSEMGLLLRFQPGDICSGGTVH